MGDRPASSHNDAVASLLLTAEAARRDPQDPKRFHSSQLPARPCRVIMAAPAHRASAMATTTSPLPVTCSRLEPGTADGPRLRRICHENGSNKKNIIKKKQERDASPENWPFRMDGIPRTSSSCAANPSPVVTRLLSRVRWEIAFHSVHGGLALLGKPWTAGDARRLSFMVDALSRGGRW